MAPYSEEQLQAYFDRIKISREALDGTTLTALSLLQRHQLAHVPFESLSLHYSQDRQISIELDDLFEKIVTRRRGGYCIENNAFFAAILRSLGFQVMHIGCRITNANRGIYDGSWRPLSHMANIVTIEDQRYLVEVGYGADGACCPLPLIAGSVTDGLSGQQLRLEYQSLPQHSDEKQRVWVYSQRRSPEPWANAYHFSETEFFPDDFTVLNYYNMSMSPFATTIVVQRFFFEQEISGHIRSGTIQLTRDRIDRKTDLGVEVLATLVTEQERLSAFVTYFDIHLSDTEAVAIRGRPSELVQGKAS